MTTPLYLRQKTDNDPGPLLRGVRLDREHGDATSRLEVVPDATEPSGNAVTGLVWGTALSIPLWALIAVGIRVLTKAL